MEMTENKRTTLAIVDNDPLVLEMMERMLRAQHAPLDIIWTAGNAIRALECCRDIGAPDVLLTDLELGDGCGGLVLAQKMHATYPETVTVGITAFAMPDENGLSQAHMATVVYKETKPSAMIRAIGQACGDLLLRDWYDESDSSPLSDTELKVIRLTARGYTYAAIGHQLGVSESTVKTHAKRAFAKLGVHSRSEAIAQCALEGLLG